MNIRKPTAQGIANLFTAAINNQNNAVLLQVKAGPANPKGRTGTRPLYAITEAPEAGTVQKMMTEGSYNSKDADPYIFTFATGSDVQVGDSFPFNQFSYKLISAYPQPLGAAVLGVRYLGIRTGQGGVFPLP